MGLGLRFLKHIARTSALAFIIDLTDESPVETFRGLLDEVGAYSEDLVAKRRLVVGSKLDLPQAEEALTALTQALPDERIMGVSSLTHLGIGELTQTFLALKDA